MLEFQCPHCSEILSIPEQFVGTTGTCRKCRKPITIEIQSTVDPGGASVSFTGRPPTLVVFQCETLGTSSRRHGIIEIAGVKTGLNGESLDTFWSFANPGHSVPEKVTERTGITDDQLADAPFSDEVLKRWFEWVGPHALMFCQHAHFNAKFMCAGLYKQDIEPPFLRIIDVVHWAKALEIPVNEYRLRPLLEYIGISPPAHHRALDACKAVVPLVAYLIRKQAGVHLKADTTGVLGRFVGKKTEVVNEEKAYAAFETISETLDDACGEDFFDRDSYRARIERRKETPVPSAMVAADGNGNGVIVHTRDWYEERRLQLRTLIQNRAKNNGSDSGGWGTGQPWMDAIVRAAECEDAAEQREHCMKAISLGSPDPWPYEQLVDYYIVAKDYAAAHSLCERFFATEGWKSSKWADISMKLLKRQHKLEHRLTSAEN